METYSIAWGRALIQHCLHPGFEWDDIPEEQIVRFVCSCEPGLKWGISLDWLQPLPWAVKELLLTLKGKLKYWPSSEKWNHKIHLIDLGLSKAKSPSRKKRLKRKRAQIMKAHGIEKGIKNPYSDC